VAHRISDADRQRIVRLYRDKYEGFNLTHFREMLQEREHLASPCREMLRRILREAGVWERPREAPRHRLRRPRREREGELLQLDASIHRWLGEDQPAIALVGAVDDATGEVPDAQFFPAETTEAYLSLLGGIVRKRGIPRAAYTDRDSVFVVNNAQEVGILRTQGRVPQTQFGRALKELGIEWIPAYSPQAPSASNVCGGRSKLASSTSFAWRRFERSRRPTGTCTIASFGGTTGALG
jgi:hypothetical protein